MRPLHALAFAIATCAATAGHAQAPAPSDAAKGMVGTWELSNADHDRACALTFKLNAVGSGYALELDPACTTQFPTLGEMVSWSFGRRDMLQLNDAKGQTVLELLEMEVGTFEGLRPKEGRYLLQSSAVAAANRERPADDFFGDWTFVRGGKPICGVTLANVAANADSFAVTVKPDCDPFITRFGPTAWKLDRGQLTLVSTKGEVWRFEENEPKTWGRVPEMRPPLTMVKQ